MSWAGLLTSAKCTRACFLSDNYSVFIYHHHHHHRSWQYVLWMPPVINRRFLIINWLGRSARVCECARASVAANAYHVTSHGIWSSGPCRMDGQTDGQRDRRTDGRTDRRTDGRTDVEHWNHSLSIKTISRGRRQFRNYMQPWPGTGRRCWPLIGAYSGHIEDNRDLLMLGHQLSDHSFTWYESLRSSCFRSCPHPMLSVVSRPNFPRVTRAPVCLSRPDSS